MTKTTIDVTISMSRSREFQTASMTLHEGATLDEGEDAQAAIDIVRADLAQQIDNYTALLLHKLVIEKRQPMP